MSRYYDNIQRVSEYLYTVEYTNLDYKAAYVHFRKRFPKNYSAGHCTSVRKGNWYGRNYDWYYDDTVEFVCYTNKKQGQFKSVGLCQTNKLDKYLVEAMCESEYYRYLPFYLTDGINENGVVANMNVVPSGDMGHTTGTTPKFAKKHEVCMLMLVRFILDRAESASQIVKYLSNYVSVYAIKNESTDIEVHYMIADKTDTYLIEFIHNELIVTKMDDRPYMTNFYLQDVEFENNQIDLTTVTPFGQGIERYNLVQNNYNSINSFEDMCNLMQKDLKYTKSYDTSTDPYWYTEFVGDYTDVGKGILTVQTPREEFQSIIDIVVDYYTHRNRYDNKTWQTVHSSIYDIEDKVVAVYSQEDGIEHIFRLNDTCQFDEIYICDRCKCN